VSHNPADEPQTHTILLSDDDLGHLKAAILMCRERALRAQEWGLATAYQILLERVERA